MKNLKGILASTLLIGTLLASAIFSKGDKIYAIKNIEGINSGDVRVVKNFQDEIKYAESWRAMTHWYDPQIVRAITFTDNSKATIQYSLFGEATLKNYLKRETPGPKIGEKYLFEKESIKKIN